MPKTFISALIVAALIVDGPGSVLTPGMQLVYASGEQEGPPWKIVTVSDTTIGGMTTCRAIVLRMDASQPPERRNWCLGGEMILAWDTASKAMRPIRPVGEGMSLVVSGARGTRLAYSTRSALEQTVSGIRMRVIETVVVTRDSSGKQTRRLREFYAPALASATSGVFEVADSTVQGGFRMQSSFKLVRIVP